MVKTAKKEKIRIKKTLHFIFSSITFLQLYLPIIEYSYKYNFNFIFYIRENKKKYACPINNERNNLILSNIINKYNIILKNIKEIGKLNEGILFLVDGDIYGVGKIKGSVLYSQQISKNIKIISLCEHMNFLWAYNDFINKVSYVIFPNEIYAKKYNLINSKNIYLGNTKFDDIPEKDIIYKKYNLNTNDKYLLFMFPKKKYIITYKIKSLCILNLYNIFRELGYKIIVKTRPKDTIFNDCKGDYNIISDTYPNESLELMKISELCVFFSSSAIDECVMMEIPSIDFVVDTEIDKRLEFLYNDNIIQQIKNWENINKDDIINTINKLCLKNDNIFKNIKEKYLFTHDNTSKKILEYLKLI
jgi:hypothetical protein